MTVFFCIVAALLTIAPIVLWIKFQKSRADLSYLVKWHNMIEKDIKNTKSDAETFRKWFTQHDVKFGEIANWQQEADSKFSKLRCLRNDDEKADSMAEIEEMLEKLEKKGVKIQKKAHMIDFSSAETLEKSLSELDERVQDKFIEDFPHPLGKFILMATREKLRQKARAN